MQFGGHAQNRHASGALIHDDCGALETGRDRAAADLDLEVSAPLAGLLGSLPLDLFAGARCIQLPLLEQLEGGDLGEIEDVPDLRAAVGHFDAAVVTDAEVAHGVGPERTHRQKDRQHATMFHYNGPYELSSGFGCARHRVTAMKPVITVQDVPGSGELRVPVGTIITPSAREVAATRGRVLTRTGELPQKTLAGESACPTWPHKRLILRGGAGASARQPTAQDEGSPLDRKHTRL